MNAPIRSSKPARAALFDLIRRIAGRGFTRAEVGMLDKAIDAIAPGAERAPTARLVSVPRISRKARNSRAIGEAGTALIKRFEGCARTRSDGRIEAYPDPGTGGDPWTIGWGATGKGLEPGSRIGPGTIWTQAQCDARLEQDLKRYAADVARAIGDTPTTQAQFDALVSFHYNTGAIARATLTKRHNALDYAGAAKEFARWNKAGGRVMKGLVRRREAEAELYTS